MNDQASASEILATIGRKLWSIMPPSAAEMHFRAAFQSGWSSAGTSWIDGDGGRGSFGWDEAPAEVEAEIEQLLRDLRELAVFANSPWNHAKVILSAAGKLRAEFALVPEEDAWAGLHMRGVSDLTSHEAFADHGVPLADWIDRAEKALVRKRRELAEAEGNGEGDRAAALKHQINLLADRLSEASQRS